MAAHVSESSAVGPARVARVRVYRLFDFYHPLDDGVDIIRVLHGKRDLETALADELIQGLEDGANGDTQ